ncbi:MAG TPA: hypothetical protein V6D28_27855 [Leptolyngbyaceae cyanobacterium]
MTNFVENYIQAPVLSIQCSDILKTRITIATAVAKVLDANASRIKLLITNLSTTSNLLFCLDKLATPVPASNLCLNLRPNESKFVEQGQYTGAGLNLFAGGFAGEILVWQWIL